MRNNVRSINESDFYLQNTLPEKIKFLLKYAVLAPSTHNSQPWFFKIENNICMVYFDPSLRMPQADPKNRDLFISMGCFLENLRIAAEYFGAFDALAYRCNQGSNLVAEVSFKNTISQAGPGDNLKKLFHAIPHRFNARGQFKKENIDTLYMEKLTPLNNFEGINVHFISEHEKIEKLAQLTAEGIKIAHGNPAFRKEISQWMRSNFSKQKDGLPGYALRIPALISLILPALVRLINLGGPLAKLNHKSITSAPLICVITANENLPLTWVKVGMLSERLMLAFNVATIKTSIFIAAIEMGNLHTKVQKILETDAIPHFLFCAGYMDTLQKLSPRHQAENKLRA